MDIARATRDDLGEIRALYLEAFPREEARAVAALIRDLTVGETEPETLSLVCRSSGRIAGSAGFSPVYFGAGAGITGYILSPLAVRAAFRGRGVAAGLIRHGRDRLAARGVDVLLVYGDPGYYGRHGFDAALGARFTPPHPLAHPFGWQALGLSDAPLPEGSHPFTCVPALSRAEYW